MKKLSILLLSISFACSDSDSSLLPVEPEVVAKADIYAIEQIGDGAYEVQSTGIGTAEFLQTGDVVTVSVLLQGMTPNSSKAVHIHSGSMTEPGRHWNQQSFYAFCGESSLGQPWGKPFAGDIGNVPIDGSGVGTLTIQTDLWALNSGDVKDILDKVIVVHEDPEDFEEECNPAHSHDHMHSNLKIGSGMIELVSDIEQKAQAVMANFSDVTLCK